ncbi:MAG: extracellular solute-binding protein [Planctomycetota bacterium]|nr:extracellular solute-binding protein [Planctomycetota bacterium]
MRHQKHGTSAIGRGPLCHTYIVALVALILGACKPTTNEPVEQVVMYVSADEYIARQVIDAFEQEYNIAVRFVGDSEAMKTTGLVNRLRQEKDQPQADVFWSSEIFQTIALARDGILDEHLSDSTADWPVQFRDGQRRWFGFAARPRVIVYAPDRIDPDMVPTTWMNLTWDTFKGRIVMADPRFGTTGGHLGAMKAYWNQKMPGFYEAFLLGLHENEIRLLPSGNAGVVRAVASGEADLGLTDADDVWAAQANGLSVKLVYPIHSPDEQDIGNGTLLIPNTVARVKGGPNPGTAKILIDFLLSERVERLLAESVSHNIPLNPTLQGAYPEYEIEDPLRVGYDRVASLRHEAIEQAMKILMEKKAGSSENEPTDAP